MAYSNYQYGTSPKKVEQDFLVKKKKSPVKAKKVKSKSAKKEKYDLRPVVYIALGFVMLFTISYRNSIINESYNEKEKLKTELGVLTKENEQLEVSIESSLNLNSVAKAAEEKLGMQKLNNNQKIYVNLQKKDYVEPASEKVLIEDEESFWSKILKKLTRSMN